MFPQTKYMYFCDLWNLKPLIRFYLDRRNKKNREIEWSKKKKTTAVQNKDIEDWEVGVGLQD